MKIATYKVSMCTEADFSVSCYKTIQNVGTSIRECFTNTFEAIEDTAWLTRAEITWNQRADAILQ